MTNYKSLTLREITTNYRPVLIGFIIILAVLLMILSFMDSKGAKLHIQAPQARVASVILNESKQKTLSASDLSIDVLSGTHSVLVAAQGYYPWAKEITIQPGEVRTLTPFLLPETPQALEISPQTDNYSTLYRMAGMQTTEKRSEDRTIRIFIDPNDPKEIKASWIGSDKPIQAFCGETCARTFTILDATESVEDIDFLPGYNDVILFAMGNTVAAIELDREGTQNYQPIYTGTSPKFYIYENIVFVRDNNKLYMVPLTIEQTQTVTSTSTVQ